MSVERDGQKLNFYIWDEGFEDARLLFSIRTLTGKDRIQEASKDNQFVLYQTDSVIYTARLETGGLASGITQEYLADSFRLMGIDSKKEG